MEKIIQMVCDAGFFGSLKGIKCRRGIGNEIDLLFFDNGSIGIKVSLHKQILQPDFWKTIVKVLNLPDKVCGNCGEKWVRLNYCCEYQGWMENHTYRMHTLVDYLFKNTKEQDIDTSIDSFFNELIENYEKAK